jgi:hypothetical protein
MTKFTRPLLAGLAFSAVFGISAASTSWAQAPQVQMVRGTIAKVDGSTITVKSREGADVMIKLADAPAVNELVKISLADVKPGAFIGTAAMPQPDGSQKAISLWIFPDWIKAPQLHTPYDVQPNSTMTNAIVDTSVTSVDGQVLTVKYPNGEKKIIVTPTTPILTYEHGDKAAIKVGAKVLVRAAKQPDGSLTAAGVTVSRDGSMPPM